MGQLSKRGALPRGWRVIEGTAHLGRLTRRRRVNVGPKLVPRNAGDLLDLKNTFGWHSAPLVNGAMSDSKLLGDLEPKPSPRFSKKLLNVSHKRGGSTAIKRSSSGMIARLAGEEFCTAQNAAMAKVKTNFKKGYPRHFVRQWRRHRGFTLEELAEMIGVTHGAISQLERGEVGYTQPMLEALAHALSCDPGELVSRNPFAKTDVSILEGLSEIERAKAIEYIEMLKLATERKTKAA